VSIVHGHLFVELLGFSQRHRTPFAFGRANWERKGKKEKNKNKIRWNTSRASGWATGEAKSFTRCHGGNGVHLPGTGLY
jgi:hypothetical protein